MNNDKTLFFAGVDWDEVPNTCAILDSYTRVASLEIFRYCLLCCDMKVLLDCSAIVRYIVADTE